MLFHKTLLRLVLAITIYDELINSYCYTISSKLSTINKILECGFTYPLIHKRVYIISYNIAIFQSPAVFNGHVNAISASFHKFRSTVLKYNIFFNYKVERQYV